MHPILNIAVRAARQAGSIIEQNAHRVDRIRYQLKGVHDFVTEVDHHAEQEIVDIITKAYPDHSITAEEGSNISGKEFEWIIDPLDGTTNYLHGFPQYCVSIAVKKNNQLEHAVVYDPKNQELYTATRGSGAHLNDKRIRTSNIENLEDALVGTGFPFRTPEHLKYWIPVFEELARKTSGIRRPGSAALDLAYVASGRYDAFWESGLKPWDIAAGTLLIQESGGLVSDFEGGSDYFRTGAIIASGTRLFDSFRQIVQRHTKDMKYVE